MQPHRHASDGDHATRGRNETDAAATFLAHLLNRARTGDAVAQEDLLAHLRGEVERQVHSRLRGKLRAREQTQDVVQEVMTDLFGLLRSLDSAEHVLRIVQRLVRHAMSDLYHRHRRQCRDVDRERHLDQLDAELRKHPSVHSVTPPNLALERADNANSLRLVLDGLRNSDREVLEMHQFRNLSFADIAAHLGINEDAARMRHKRAMVELVAAWKRRHGGIG